MKNTTIHWNNLLGAIAALLVFILTGQGILQQYIDFPGVANEIGFAFMSLFLAVILFIMSFSKTSK